ncbi:MAG: tRNA pseudouridine(13) synthase TruD [Planctomycetaceae bacterium]|nr:tRNA pseudouridine(13) synthase TruD [Planctomycetaceae bacterium]
MNERSTEQSPETAAAKRVPPAPPSHGGVSAESLSPELLSTILRPPAAWAAVLPSMIIRHRVSDFVVQEQPKYLPSGSGEHLYLWVEKTDVAAGDLVSRLARALQISQRDIGTAGQKDRRAITRQFVSVPQRCEALVDELALDGIRVLTVQRHTNKLKTGHLAGNRFELVLRAASPDAELPETAVDAVRGVLQQMADDGFPNYFGEQRFGHQGGNVSAGIDYLRDPGIARTWSKNRRRYLSRMLPSAVQSAVFNLIVAERVQQGQLRTLLEGDVVCRRGGTRPFLAADADEQIRSELVPMGPMPGPDMLPAQGRAAERERECLSALGISGESFAQFKRHSQGTRRPMVVCLSDVECELVEPSAVRVKFTLPAGSFATVVVQQLCDCVVSSSASSSSTV